MGCGKMNRVEIQGLRNISLWQNTFLDFHEGYSEVNKKFQIGPCACWHFFENTYFSVFCDNFLGLTGFLRRGLRQKKWKKLESGPIQGWFGKNQTFGHLDHAAEFLSIVLAWVNVQSYLYFRISMTAKIMHFWLFYGQLTISVITATNFFAK